MKLGRLLRIVVSGVLLAFLIWKADTARFSESLRRVDIWFISAALGILLISTVINTYRWRMLLIDQGISITFLRLLSVNFIGLFFSVFLPGRTGGDVIRGYYLTKEFSSGTKAVSTIIVWRVIGIVALIVIGFISTLVSIRLIDNLSMTFSLLLGMLVVFAVIFSFTRRSIVKTLNTFMRPVYRLFPGVNLERKMKEIYESTTAYANRMCMLGQNLAVGLVTHGLIIVSWYVISHAVSLDVPFAYFLMFIPLVGVIQVLPISLNGIGVREGVAVYLFSKIGVDNSSALLMGILYSFITLSISFAGGVVYACRK